MDDGVLAMSLIVTAGTAGMILARPSGDPAAVASGLRAGAVPRALERAPAPPIRLRDAAGGRFDSRELAGQPHLVTFVYASAGSTRHTHAAVWLVDAPAA